MKVRARKLPGGWYPVDGRSVGLCLDDWNRESGRPPASATAAIAPHAGWTYSGRIAWESFLAGSSGVETIVIIGGHLPAGAPVLWAGEDAFETPFGPVESDSELRDRVLERLEAAGMGTGEDHYADNTVEVLLPLAASRYPGARVLWLRAPNESGSIAVGEAVADAATGMKRRILLVGSTDLTHYGPSYGFEPAGGGSAAVAWAKRNDRDFVEAALRLDERTVIRTGTEGGAACSAGAVCAAIGYARRMDAVKAELLELGSSLDVAESESFVGYASISYS